MSGLAGILDPDYADWLDTVMALRSDLGSESI
jgi:hypothetical protein